MADHRPVFSHNAINRYLMEDDVSAEAVWLAVRDAIRRSENACLIFDDTVLDKRHSFKIELVRRQYSGNEHGIVKGIGVVNCLYANLDTGEHWVVDWRVYNPGADGKSKLDHVRDMFDDALLQKGLPFRTVLMDSWYAAKETMTHTDRAGEVFYCPLKCNRLVDDSQGNNPYQAVADLGWFGDEMLRGKLVKIHGFPKDNKVRLFRVAATNRTEYVATNDLSQNSGVAVKGMCAVRWKVERYHREGKQMLGIEKCQCRSARAQKNHIGCVILAWHCLTKLAKKLKTNIYALKNKLLSEYMREELKNPSIRMDHV
jgi:SRSO17 transposase